MVNWLKKLVERRKRTKALSIFVHRVRKRVASFLWSLDKWHHVAIVRYKEGGDALYVDGNFIREFDPGVELISDQESKSLFAPQSRWTIEFYTRKKKVFDPKSWGKAQFICFSPHFRSYR